MAVGWSLVRRDSSWMKPKIPSGLANSLSSARESCLHPYFFAFFLSFLFSTTLGEIAISSFHHSPRIPVYLYYVPWKFARGIVLLPTEHIFGPGLAKYITIIRYSPLFASSPQCQQCNGIKHHPVGWRSHRPFLSPNTSWYAGLSLKYTRC
jgi:hypothetical protein